MKTKKPKKLFTTDNVDDSYFMSSELHISEGLHDKTLEFHIDGQRDNAEFTIYQKGIVDLHRFLTEWIIKNI